MNKPSEPDGVRLFDTALPPNQQMDHQAVSSGSDNTMSTEGPNQALPPPHQQLSAASTPDQNRHTRRKLLPRLDQLLPTEITLTDADIDAMAQQAEKLIEQSLQKSQAAWDGRKQIFDDPKQWKLHYAKANLTVYRKRDKHADVGNLSTASSSTARRFLATGRVPGLTLQDVEYGKYCDTTLDERSTMAYHYGDYFVDAAVLKVFHTQTDDDPFRFFGIKWLATISPGGNKILSPRDYAFFEYAKTVVSEHNNQKILVKVIQSISNDIVPTFHELESQNTSHSSTANGSDFRLVRGYTSMVNMYHFDLKTSTLQVFAEGTIDPCGRAPTWLGSSYLSYFAPTLIRIEHCADIKYIMKHGMVFPHAHTMESVTGASSVHQSDSRHSPTHSNSVSSVGQSPGGAMKHSAMLDQPRASWVPDSQRKVCFVCFKSFSIVRRHRHHCRMCGEVMCSRCMIRLPVVPPPTDATCAADGNGNNTQAATALMLQHQPASKKALDEKHNGLAAINGVKLCKKCLFTIRQERKGTMYGIANFQFTSSMLRQFPNVVLRGTRSYHGGEHPYYYHDNQDEQDDDEEEDEEQYSLRIERLRQEHMQREKEKNKRLSILLYDEDLAELEIKPSRSNPSSTRGTDSGAVEFDFDHLLLHGHEGNRHRKSHSVASNNNTGAYTTGIGNQSGMDASIRTRSFSIPDQFQQVERSIARQEALIQSINLEHAKLRRGMAMEALSARSLNMDGGDVECFDADIDEVDVDDAVRKSMCYSKSPQNAVFTPTARSTISNRSNY